MKKLILFFISNILLLIGLQAYASTSDGLIQRLKALRMQESSMKVQMQSADIANNSRFLVKLKQVQGQITQLERQYQIMLRQEQSGIQVDDFNCSFSVDRGKVSEDLELSLEADFSSGQIAGAASEYACAQEIEKKLRRISLQLCQQDPSAVFIVRANVDAPQLAIGKMQPCQDLHPRPVQPKDPLMHAYQQVDPHENSSAHGQSSAGSVAGTRVQGR